MNTFPYILLNVIIVVADQIFVKKGLNLLGTLDFSAGFITPYIQILLSPMVTLGLSIYIMGVFFWLYVLSKVELSFAYPFLGLTFVFVALASHIFLGASLSVTRGSVSSLFVLE